MRRLAIILSAFVFAVLGAGVPVAQQSTVGKRIALVIGNDAYVGGDANPRGLMKLANPVRDARAVAALLKQHGFEVIEGYDLDYDSFGRLVASFSRAVNGANTALVFYGGHGMEVVEKDDLINVLAPTNAEIDCETRAHTKTIGLDQITRATRGAANQIIILDACRNNPFPNCPIKLPTRRVLASELRFSLRGVAKPSCLPTLLLRMPPPTMGALGSIPRLQSSC
jgi:uncharacterized caspase-like protein